MLRWVNTSYFPPLLLFFSALLFLSFSVSISLSLFSPNREERSRLIYASVVANDRRDRDRFQEKHHRRIPVTENYTLTGLYPNTLYYVWLAARSQRGEGATTIPYPVRTKQYGKQTTKRTNERTNERTSEKSEKKGGGKKKRKEKKGNKNSRSEECRLKIDSRLLDGERGRGNIIFFFDRWWLTSDEQQRNRESFWHGR